MTTRGGMSRRQFVAVAAGAAAGHALAAPPAPDKALIAITLDLEMSREYPTRDRTEWDFRKGDLDEPTKRYAVEAAKLVKERGGVIHFFCVASVLEQEDVGWLKQIIEAGHPVGNHTYDHVNVKAATLEQVQHRFKRAPWLIEGMGVEQVIRNNIATATRAMKARLGVEPAGFRTPGGFADGLHDRPDLQRMLLDLGFNWVSSLYPSVDIGERGVAPTPEVLARIAAAQPQARPFAYPSGLIEVPMNPVSDVHAFRDRRWKLDDFLRVTRLAVDRAIDQRATFDFLAHPSCLVVEDPGFATIKMICDRVAAAGDLAAIADLGTLARRVG